MSSNSVSREETPLVASDITSAVASPIAVFTIVLAVVTIVLTVGTVVAVVLTVVAISTNGKINSVIDRSALGNWHENGLVVRSGGDGRHPVCTSRESLGNIRSELTIGSSIVETLEESKNTWVRGLRRAQGLDRFNYNVVVSDDLPSVVQLLRCSIVGIGSVGKVTSLHPLRIHDNGKRGVSLDIAIIGRKLELDGRHVVDTRNVTHRRRVARASLNLLSICDGLADTEVDKVVGADEGVCFTGCLSFTIDVLNDRGVQGEGSVVVAVVIITVVVVPIVVGPVVVAAAVVVTSVVVVAPVVVVTAVVVVAAVTASLIVLTGCKTIRLRDEEGSGELGNNEEDEREFEALHDSLYRWKEGQVRGIWVWEERRYGFEASFFVEKGVKKEKNERFNPREAS